jgi:ABC-2 type transport system ATP-binding protein
MQRHLDPDHVVLTGARGTGLMAACELEDVRVEYGGVLALDVDALSIGPGVTGLVGVNGAGKTSLLNALVGLVRPRTGSVLVGGEPVTRRTLRDVRRRIGLAPQQFRAPGNLVVEDLVTYLGWLHGLSPGRAGERAAVVLDQLGLAGKRRARVSQLSGGMHRRVAIAQAIVHDPEVLLLDEPTAGLDPEQRHLVRDVVADAAAGRTTVISSHMLEDVVRWSDSMLVLDEGRVAFHGAVEAFWAEAARRGVVERDGELAFLAVVGRGR